MEEIEAKFVLPDSNAAEAALRVLAGTHEVHALGAENLQDEYLDDRKGRLATAGWACRIRCRAGEGDFEQRSIELKSLNFAAHSQVQVRREVEQPLFESLDLPFAVLELADGDVRSVLLESGAGRLSVLFRLNTRRDRYSVVARDGGEFEVCVDRSHVSDKHGHVVERFEEVEVEATSASMHQLARVASQLAGAGLVPSELSKYQRGAWAAGVSRPKKIARVSGQDDASLLVQRQLTRWMVRIDHYGKLADEGNSRGVHLLRTNVRRVRAALAVSKPELGDAGRHFSSVLGELARGVGDVRDLDVFAESIDKRLSEFLDVSPRARSLLVARLLGGRNDARTAAQRALASLPSVLAEWRHMEAQQFVGQWPSAAEFGERILFKRWRQLRRAGRRLRHDSPDADLHAVRLLAKRLRYALELLTPLYGKEAKGYARIAQAVQEDFGDHQDACVAIELLTRVAQEMPNDGHSREALVLLGRVLQDQYAIAETTRAQAFETWRKYDRLIRKSDLRKLVSSL